MISRRRQVYEPTQCPPLPPEPDSDLNKSIPKQPTNKQTMKIESYNHLLVLALTLWGANSIGTTEPDGTPDPTIPPGFFAADGEINDPTIPSPAPEFLAPPDGTPNISSKSI